MTKSQCIRTLIFLVTVVTIAACGGQNLKSPSVAFDLSDAQSLILESPQTNSSNALSTDSTLTTDEAISNLKKFVSNGTLENVVYKTDNNTQSYPIKASQIIVSPAGDVIAAFETFGVNIGGDDCAVVTLFSNSAVFCMVPFTYSLVSIDQGFFPSIRFDQAGNIYFKKPGSSNGDIMKMSRTGVISELLDANKINLFIGHYIILPDESVLLNGQLDGSLDSFFQFIPKTGQLKSLNEFLGDPEQICPASLSPPLQIPAFTFDMSENGTLYVDGTCSGALHIRILRGQYENGIFNFQAIYESDDPFLFEFYDTHVGDIYAVSVSGQPRAIKLFPSVEEIDFSELKVAIDYVVRNNFIYITGINTSDENVFIRRRLATNGEVTDLLGGKKLLVQHFDVSENGDVYFGALDLDTTTVFFYRFNSSTEQVEQYEALPGDLLDVIVF